MTAPNPRPDKSLPASVSLHGGPLDGTARGLDHLQFHTSRAWSDHVNLASRRPRQIDDPLVDEGSAIGDADFHLLSVRKVRHFNPHAERQRAMRGGKTVASVDSIKRRGLPSYGQYGKS